MRQQSEHELAAALQGRRTLPFMPTIQWASGDWPEKMVRRAGMQEGHSEWARRK
ncbi:MAG: hypothetical protein M3442_14245 [Chloroflexota bacterium]|nr:hypothetical protein [Chloroflexota bacterium]